MGRILVLLIGLAVIIAALMSWKQNAFKAFTSPTIESSYWTPDDRIIEVAGANVRVRETGVKNGPPIVLLHGFTFSLETWDAWATELEKTHRVIRFDQLGHGLTGADPELRYSPEERAAFLDQVLDKLKLDRVALAGNSLGGQVAWHFASDQPDRVEKLILLAPGAFSINGVTSKPAPIPPNIEQYMLHAPAGSVRASLMFLFGNQSLVTDERVALATAMMQHGDNGQAFVDHLKEFTLPDPSEKLSKITAPTLILWGQMDLMIPVLQAHMVKNLVPNAEVIVYPGVGHLPQEEHAAKSVADAIAFLNK